MGFATDFSGYKPEKLQAIRELAKEVGLVYGGNWSGKTFDPVHIQLGPGSDVTRYIQGHIDPKAGTVNWEGVRSTQLPEDFIARAIAAAQGQNVPVKEVKVEGAPNATGSVTAAAEPAEVADAKVEVTKKRSKDIDLAKLIKMLDDSSKGGGDMLRNAMQSNAQRQQEQRSRTLSQIAQFDQEQVNKMAEALKGGKAQGYKEGGDVGEGSSSTEGSPAGDASGGFGGGVGGQSGNTAGSSADTTGGSPAGDASGGFGGGVGNASGSGNQGGGSSSGGVSDTGGTGFGGDIMGGSFGKSPDVGVTLGTEEMGPAAPTSVAAPTATQVESALATLAAGLIAEAAALSKSSTVDVAETEAETQALEGSNITGGSPAGDASGGFGGGIGSGTSTSTESPSTGDISNGSGAGGNEIIPVSLMTSGPNTLTKLANSLESINAKYGVAPKIEDSVIKNNLAEGGKVKLHDLYYKYAEGGPKLPDRPEYEITDNSDAVDMTPAGPWERTFQKVTGGRNLQNDLSNIQSRLPTMEDYGKALLHQRDVAQETSELGRHNLREGYTNRDLPQMLLGTGQGILGVVSPAMTPVNAGLDVLVNTAGKFDPRAKAEAERISLMGTEGTGAAHGSLKTLGDAVVKASERVKLPEASLIALPAAVAAAERPIEAATRSLSPIGLYSHAAEMAEALPQAKGTPKQMRAMLFDKYGVKPAELEGFEEKFFGRPSVTKEELATHFRERMPQVEEKVLGARPSLTPKEQLEWENLSKRFEEKDMTLKMEDAERMSELDMKKQRLPDSSNPTKFEKWSLPGGENYREVLLKLPTNWEPKLQEKYGKFGFEGPDGKYREYWSQQAAEQAARSYKKQDGDFTSTHWPEDPNVLAHVRMSDRTGPNGEKLLHVEEIQSDWGQRGRKEGFDKPKVDLKPLEANLELARMASVRLAQNMIERESGGKFNNFSEILDSGDVDLVNRIRAAKKTDSELIAAHEAYQTADRALQEARAGNRSNVPSAPYVTSTQGWTDLALKRVLKEAAEGGYDGIVFTPGAEQAKRYDLSQQIDELAHWRMGDEIGLSASGPEGAVLDQHYVSKEKLPSVVGKELAEKILNGEGSSKSITGYPEEQGVNFISGEDLFVGGEGMKSYYDKMMPSYLKELAKQHDKDAKLGTLRTNSLPDMLHLPVTDKMREHILKGQKAYKRGGRVGYADGGLVADNADGTGRQQYDAYGNVSDSQGGPVHAVQYDPDRINMMAQQLHEGTYG